MRADIETHYVNGYLTNLALAWGRFLEPPNGLLTQWRIRGFPTNTASMTTM